MDMEYDRKFEEMKGYIPFLENMIKRLESTGAIENPRQAQLDKIRSLRDLLLDKKKRMKMENLLKCEQVLVNLYAKVEQRDSLPGIKKDSARLDKENPESSAVNSKSNLEIVRNKLKTVAGVVCDNPETLPEIARANESEVTCSLSGKEPALFQRRPNKASISPPKDSPNKRLDRSSPHSSNSRRGYTRILLSPELDKKRWSSTECPSEKVLYSRRSPHRSPRKRSPLHHKKDKKKSSKQELSSRKAKDLNITLKVPEESLKSLNTKDILSRIINCSDSDVDIDTLRELRKQILGELKQTGANDDISDLILKSYKNTKKKTGKAKEVEEGELSDSESEAIDSIYGSLIVVEKDRNSLKSSEVRPTSEGENQSCKIQISLVINANTENKVDSDRIKTHNKVTDETEFEMYNKEHIKSVKLTTNEDETSCKVLLDEPETKSNASVVIIDDEDMSTVDKDITKINEDTNMITNDTCVSNTSVNEKETVIENNKNINEKDKNEIHKNTSISKKDSRLIENDTSEIIETKNLNISSESLSTSDRKIDSSKIGNENKINVANTTNVETPFKPNFYKPLEHDLESKEGLNNSSDESVPKVTFEKSSSQGIFSNKEEETIEIPLLNLESDPPIKPAKQDVMSEIDILQALKNEILSDTISIPGTDIATPALHQPKLIKVANAQEIKPKKRISIENYKEKAISKPLFVKEPSIDDLSKKQSLKLTEKECERFNFPTKLPLLSSDEDEDEEIDKSSVTLDDIYENIAPKSPDDETSTEIEKTIPVIIPIDPIKNLPTGSAKADVDMRTMVPNMSSDVIHHIPSLSAVNNNSDNIDVMKKENKTGEKGLLTDPRLKRDANLSVGANLNIHSTNPDRTPLLASPYRNIIPNRTPSMTPNAKSYEMTPYQSFETSENSNRRHVYAPTLLNHEMRDQRETSVNRELSRWKKSDKVVEENNRFDPSNNDGSQTKWDNQSRRGSVQRDDVDPKSNYSDPSPNYELYPYRNRHETYENNYSFNRSDQFGRSDIAQTPVRTFGRSECSSTPIHPFGRSDCPTTPIHPFGRSDCPSTPSHSFGRSDCPTTPLHPFGRQEVQTAMKSQFGRSDCPTTPVHHFGRSETPLTPVNSFGRSDYSQNQLSSNPRFGKDPRLNRSQDYDSSNRNHYDSGRNNSFERDRNISKYKWDARGNSYKPDFNQRSHDNSEPYRNFSKEQSVGRNKSHPSNLNREITCSREYRDGVNSRFDLRRDRNTSKSTEDVGIKRSYHRERIGGYPTSSDEFSRLSKTFSDFKSTRDNTSNNRLSVKAHAGRSFTIDTSINRSFQEIMTKRNTLPSNDMYSRRQRAASVGRTIIRESSVDRNLSSDIHRNRNANFRRAQSVGRDVAKYKSEKSLKDMKAQFESFKANLEERKPINCYDSKRKDYPLKEGASKYLDPRTRKERQQESNNSRQGTYLPKKNIRDPRLRRELYDNSNKNRDSRKNTSFGIVYSNDNIAKGTVLRAGTGVKNYKIPKIKRPVEETDETTTEIIGKDKNAEEKDSTTVKNVPITNTKESVKETVEKADSKISNEVLDKKNVNDGDGDENIQKRVTRSSKKSSEKSYDEEEYKTKPKKNRKAIIQDSDSDTIDSIKSEDKKISSPKKQKSVENSYKSDTKIQDHVCEKVLSKDTEQKNNVIDILPKDTNKQIISIDSTIYKEHIITNKSPASTPEKITKTRQDDGLNSSFSLDDLELFPDNVGSDSVIDNINSLIADLDNDLDSDKPIENIGHVTGETSMENITVNINEDKCNLSRTNENETLNVINEFIKNDSSKEEKIVPQNLNLNKTISESFTPMSKLNLNNSVSELNNIDTGNNDVNDTLTKKSEKGSDKIVDNLNDGDISTSVEENCVDNLKNAVVSTTADKQKAEPTVKFTENYVVNLEKRIDHCSTPDSTINTDETQIDTDFNDKKLPRSIEISHTELNSDVTSTHDSIEKEAIKINETDSQQKQNFPQTDPFGSLLSILQKSKIRELLHMLDDKSSDSEKIKRKLEKLSEIVSDDEDTDSVKPDKNETKNENNNALQNFNDLTTTNLTCVANKFIEETNDKNEQPQPNASTNKINEANNETKECDNLVTEGNSEDVSNAGMVHTGKDQTTTKLSCDSIKTSEETNYRKEQLTTTANELTKTINTTNDDAKELHDSIGTIKSYNVDNTGEDKKNTAVNDDNIADDEVNKILKDIPIVKKSSSVIPTKKKVTKKARKKAIKNRVVKEKSATRSVVSGTITDKPKSNIKRSRELMRLQDDIREMFISDDVLNVTGIRMCRLAKLADDNGQNQKDSQDNDNLMTGKVAGEEQSPAVKTMKKRPGPKAKVKSSDKVDLDNTEKAKSLPKYKPGPKSKTKIPFENSDPYAFETDSNVGTHSIKEFEKSLNSSSDSESDSSSIKSRGSFERVTELKKKKKKRSSWQAGVIKPKNKKKKDIKQTEATLDTAKATLVNEQVTIPDLNCFTDKSYCFNKNVVDYPCRLCSYSGVDIVHHYKKQHPHTEIPLSRMNPEIAKEAIEQCEDINFKEISKMPTEKYVCRFCFKEFSRKKATLEAFFWHIVSVHTGEYKHLCSECVNDRKCPFNLDIPPPPKDVKGQLIGYICGKCNFTQISVENLKTHVIDRHNDEETEVYTINLAVMTKKTFSSLLKRCKLSERPRLLRSSRSNQSLVSDDLSDVTESEQSSVIDSVRRSSLSQVSSITKNDRVNIKSKLTFENDDSISDNSVSYLSKSMDITNEIVKSEQEDHEDDNDESTSHVDGVFDELPPTLTPEENKNSELDNSIESNVTLGDVVTLPHFKIQYTETGAREYVCCINGNDRHYKTAMTISMKKHVQLNHKENWDGFCFICKLIVTTQGNHNFKDCFQHFIDKHMDEFPILDNLVVETTLENEAPITSTQEVAGAKSTTKNFIYVRPICELLPQTDETQSTPEDSTTSMPKIQSVVSLGSPAVDQPLPSPTYPKPCERKEPPKAYKYEEWQAVVMSKKHRIVLESMMSRSKLIHIFKCAGRFCSFSTDCTEDALLHASTHQRVGGEGALDCAYCDFDTTSNAIDLVMHVFKKHSCCQYLCGLCFYRAAASQLVNAHFIRAHPESPMVSVLCTTAAPKPCNEDEAKDLLPRKDAVQFYSCAHLNPDNSTCKFRSYISNKFSEHLQQRHPDLPHDCNMCSYSSVDPNELVQHMKTHDIMLYQCTWCVHGADQESELLAHCSAKHPDKQPQAYLRIITSKHAGLRMLPLAQLNISKVPTEELSPAVNHENPVREAERSIELEKLIGHTMMMIESSQPSQPEPERFDSTGLQNMLTPARDVSAPNLRMLLTESSYPTLGTQSRPITPLRAVTPVQEQPTSEAITPVLKMEPEESTPEKAPNNSDIIYSLDSDDESVGIIDLSREVVPLAESNKAADGGVRIIDLSCQEVVPPAEPNKAAPPVEITAPNTTQAVATSQPITDQMYKCERCNIYFADVDSLKDHIPACYPYLKSVSKCPICSFKPDNQEVLLAHIKTCMSTKFTRTPTESLKMAKRYVCGICRCVGPALVVLKAHLKQQHSVSKIRIESEVVDTIGVFTVFEHVNKPKTKGKRKLSATTAAKQKGYGPLDIDQLPINPILDELVYCNLCGFNTKVRLNMVRHLQRHAEQQPVAKTAPVNPVPHLETNEKHFDKMLNLASSSLVNRPDKSSKADGGAHVAHHILPEAASRYPKYVPERQRHTCGATGCSYISLDEDMLKCHWETLHANSSDYRCVHCPPYQQLDRSRPLTAARIIAHLKMHDVNLYACSLCSYYHYKRNILEKHLVEVHKGGRALVVRGEGAAPAPGPSAPAPSTPTMDLRPWQCGLCQFKSMIRPEVVEHCAKTHQSKMQYKCSYCPFRTSAVENVTKHQSTSHAEKQPEIFYYYYKEGDLPDEPDGTPRWAKQQQRAPKQATEVKTEVGDNTTTSTQPKTVEPLSTKVAPISVDLNMVKIEVDTDSNNPVTSIEDLCKKYGLFCGPNGLKFKCPLCKVVTEDTEEVMQSHLYEELRYRKWGCRICSYKGFHKKGLDEHMTGEHGANAEPLELPLDVNVESWVTQLLKYQSDLIEKNRDNLARQKIQFESSKAQPSTSRAQPREQLAPDNTTKQSMKELEETFGQFGAPRNDCYRCPKCDFETSEESAIRDHLETELTKIRWSCSRCSEKFQNYHEAQFHCKSVHPGQPAHPSEVIRSSALRSAWVAAVVRMQGNSMSSAAGGGGCEDSSSRDRAARAPSPDDSENSLLVVRFEQKVPTLEGAPPSRKRPLPAASANDSDEERLVIDESLEAPPQSSAKKPRTSDKCPYCPVIPKTHQRLSHILKHYNLQCLSCPYCNHTNSRKKAIVTHIITVHPNQPVVVHKTEIPEVSPSQYLNVGTLTKTCPVDAMIRLCLVCLLPFTEAETASHKHAYQPPRYASIGNIIVKCGNCASGIFEDVNSLHFHHSVVHKYVAMDNYTFFRIYATKDVTSPTEATWSVKISRLEKKTSLCGDDRKNTSSPVQKRKNDDCTIMPSPKRVARKSTTKLPYTAVAKKSTTKLPLYVYSDSELDSEDEEYSYYGTRPTPLHELDNVTTLMPFYNRLMRFSVKKLNEIININPQVRVEDTIKN